MKRAMFIVMVVVLMATGSYVVFAKGHMGGMMGRGMRGGGMMDSNDMMMQKGMMGMHPMAGMMYGGSMVGTTDDGVVVLVGNKLIKYDKDLNLVKEVEIKIDWESYKKVMEQHRNTMMQQHNMMMGKQGSMK